MDPQHSLNQTFGNQSDISLYLDMSNYQITLIIERQLVQALGNTVEDLLNTTENLNPVVVHAIYGSKDASFGDFLAPGMIGLITFAHAIGATAIAFVREKIDGCMDRIFVAGVSSGTVVVAHLLTHSGILILQAASILALTVGVFDVSVAGFFVVQLLLMFAILISLGLAGMSFGLLVSGLAREEVDALRMALGSFFPMLLLSGVMWPLQAIPKWFVWVSYALPTTWAAEGLRSVMTRGWGITAGPVWRGILIPMGWTVALLILSSLIVSSRDSQISWWRYLCCATKKKRS